jgi:hypothetical protein
VTDKNGCNNIVSVTITQPGVIRDSMAILNNPDCNSGNGSATIGIKGGTSPYTFTWTHGVSTTATATNLSAGTYTVTVKDAHSCTGSTVTFTVTQPVAIRDSMVAGTKINVSCNGGNNGSATVGAKYGKSPYTYSWSPNVGSSNTVTGLSAGTYSVSVTDNNGCTSSVATITITQPGSIRDSVSAQVNVGCNGGNGGSATIGVKYGKAPYTFSWSPNISFANNASGLSAGTYAVSITDNNGCNTSTSVTITQPLAIRDSVASIIYPSCHGSIGSVSIGVKYGTAPYTYNWSPSISSSATATNLVAGTYTVNVKDNHSCSTVLIFTVTQPTAVGLTLSSHNNVLCNGGLGDASINQATGGTPPYNYLWSPAGGTNLTATNLQAGTYTITATDNNGCVASNYTTITQPNALRDSVVSIVNPLCNSDYGSVLFGTKYGTAPYTYFWSDGSSTQPFSNPTGPQVPAGSYTITIVDKNGCSTVDSVSLAQPVAMTVTTAVITNNTCYNSFSGSAVASASGGKQPFTYQWSDANTTTTATVNNLSAGIYQVTVTDNNGCIDYGKAIINQPGGMNASASVISYPPCYGTPKGSVTVAVGGGNPPFTYSWVNSANTVISTSRSTQQTLGPDTYMVTVWDSCGNSVTSSVTVTQPAAIRDSVVSSTGVPCYGVTGGSVTVGVTGGTFPYIYEWTQTSSSSIPTRTSIPGGAYKVTIVDANGCSSVLDYSITQPAPILYNITQSNISCYGGSNGSATATIINGVSPFTYLWSNGETNETATGLNAGTYEVYAVDNNGCSGQTVGLSITQPAPIALTVDSLSCNSNLLTIGINAAGGTSPYNYLWSPGGQTQQLLTGLAPGFYSITVTDANGCSIVSTQNYNCPPSELHRKDDKPDLSEATVSTIDLYPNPNSGTFTLSGLEEGQTIEMYDYTGRMISSQLVNDNIQTTMNIAGQPAGIYLVRILDKNGNLVMLKKMIKTN